MNIHQITFSPTGGTRRVSELLCKGITDKSHTTELCTKEKDFIPPSIATDDLAVISMPVYAGRVPTLAVERLKNIKSSGAKCIIIAVYGNRAYEDALVEMQDIATETGFQVVAAVAAIAEHSICREYATGRPDDADARELASLGVAIFEKIKRDTHFKSLTLPGNRPYKQGCTGPFPTANERCTNCGTCARLCPTDATSIDSPQKTTQRYALAACAASQYVPLEQEVLANVSRNWQHISSLSAAREKITRYSCKELLTYKHKRHDRTSQIQCKPRAEHQTCLNALTRCSLWYIKIILAVYLSLIYAVKGTVLLLLFYKSRNFPQISNFLW